MKSRQRILLLVAGLIIAAMAWYFLAYQQPIKIWVDGRPSTVISHAHRVGDVLASAGLQLRPGDQLDPPLGTFFLAPPEIHLEREVPVQIWDGEKKTSLVTSERNPEKILQLAGLKLNPVEEIWESGEP